MPFDLLTTSLGPNQAPQQDYFGPEGADRALVERVTAAHDGLRQGNIWPAVCILGDLGRKRDQASRREPGLFDRPFQAVRKDGMLALRGRTLPRHIQRLVGRFLLDPAELALRADRAMAWLAADQPLFE